MKKIPFCKQCAYYRGKGKRKSPPKTFDEWKKKIKNK